MSLREELFGTFTIAFGAVRQVVDYQGVYALSRTLQGKDFIVWTATVSLGEWKRSMGNTFECELPRADGALEIPAARTFAIRQIEEKIVHELGNIMD